MKQEDMTYYYYPSDYRKIPKRNKISKFESYSTEQRNQNPTIDIVCFINYGDFDNSRK